MIVLFCMLWMVASKDSRKPLREIAEVSEVFVVGKHVTQFI